MSDLAGLDFYPRHYHGSYWQPFDPRNPWDTLEPWYGCYVILGNRQGAIYVGSSVNVRDRVLSYCIHKIHARTTVTPWGVFNDPIVGRVKYMRRLGDYRMVEERLIYRLKPIGNKAMNCGQE